MYIDYLFFIDGRMFIYMYLLIYDIKEKIIMDGWGGMGVWEWVHG